jgi:hypothetical protein
MLIYYLCLIFLFMISLGMSGYFGTGPLRACLGTSVLVPNEHE